MTRLPAAALLLGLGGCALLLPPPPQGAAVKPVTTARAVHLARVRCLLVAPFDNASDDPLAAEAATAALVAGINANRTTIYPIAELRALFKDTSLELPEGLSGSLALEMAELIGADATLYGLVEGRSRGSDAQLRITLRLAAAGARDVLFTREIDLRPDPEAPLAAQVRTAVVEAAAPMLDRLGVPGQKGCFDRRRTDRLRLMALAGEQRALYPPQAPVTAPLPPAPPPVGTTASPEAPVAVASATATAQPALPPPPPPPTPAPSQTAEVGTVEILPAFPRIPRSTPIKVESAADLPEPPAATPAVAAPVAAAPPGGEPAPPAAASAGTPPERPPESVAPRAPREKKAAAGKAKAEKGAKKLVASAEGGPDDGARAPRTKTLSVRQGDWLTRLQRGGRVLVEDVAFAGRSGTIEREGGLRDVAALLGAAPNLRIRIEGFVDSTNDPDDDLRVSMEMARAAGKRLIELGVTRDRLSWAGRGGESPILPNFTVRGRMGNRRVELIPAE